MLIICRELFLILFSVSMAWSMYNLLDQYPRMHRFGHVWDKWIKKQGAWQERGRRWDDLKIVITCWFLLAATVMASLYSLSQAWEGIANLADTRGTGAFFLVISGLLAFIYLFIPYLINRLVWSLLLLVVPEDFKEYATNSDKREHYLIGRFSPETIDTLLHHTRFRGFLISLDSIWKLSLLILIPRTLLLSHPFSNWSIFAILLVAIMLTILVTIPYGKWVDDRLRKA